MKKISLFAVSLMVVFLSLSSCQKDDSLDPRPVLVSGTFMRLDITKKRLNFDDLANATFGGMLTNPGGKAVKYKLSVRRTDTDTGQAGDFVDFPDYTSFPVNLQISAGDLATVLGITLGDLKRGDKFSFKGVAFDAAGTRTDFYNLSSTIQSNQAYYKEAFKFQTDIGDNGNVNDSDVDNYIGQ